MNISLLQNNNYENYKVSQLSFKATKNNKRVSGTLQSDCFQRNTSNIITKSNPMLAFFSPDMPKELQKMVDSITMDNPNLSDERLFNKLISTFNNWFCCTNQNKYLLEKPISDFFLTLYPNAKDKKAVKKVIQILENAGVNTTKDLDYFVYIMHCYIEDPKMITWEHFKDPETEITNSYKAFNIYSKLDTKTELVEFPVFLRDYYDYCQGRQTFEPNNIITYLKFIGCKTYKDIDPKIEHIKKYFNNFETQKDKIEAIEYLTSTCNDKLRAINQVLLKTGTKAANIIAEDIYTDNNKLIDELYLTKSDNFCLEIEKQIDTLIEPYKTGKKQDYNPYIKRGLVNYYFKPSKGIQRIHFSTATENDIINAVNNMENSISRNSNETSHDNLENSISRNSNETSHDNLDMGQYNLFPQSYNYEPTQDYSFFEITSPLFRQYSYSGLSQNLLERSYNDEVDMSQLHNDDVDVKSIINYALREQYWNNYIDRMSLYVDIAKNVPIDLFNHFIIKIDDDNSRKEAEQINDNEPSSNITTTQAFNEALNSFNYNLSYIELARAQDDKNRQLENWGFKTTKDLIDFIKIFNTNDTKQLFNMQIVDAFDIYSKLKDKNDLALYGEFLRDIYYLEADPENFNPEQRLNFMKKLKLSNFDEFEEKFSHLKSKFNDFETTSDKVNALDYLQSTYDKKINILSNALGNLPKAQRTTQAEKIYSDYNNFIDLIYEKNSQKNLEPIQSNINLLTDFNKLDLQNKILGEYFNNLQLDEDKIKLFEFLSTNNLSINDINQAKFKENSILQNNNNLQNLANKNEIIRELVKTKILKPDEAKKSFEQFSDLYNSIYNNGEFSADNLKNLVAFLKSFNIQNDNTILNIYNEVTSRKESKITDANFKEFINFMSVLRDKAKVKNQKTLKIEMERFNGLKATIKNAIDFDIHCSTNLFSGKSLMEIYLENRAELNKNPLILEEKIMNSENSKDKFGFYSLFKDSSETYEFLSKNTIKANSNEKEEKLFAKQCYSILSKIKDDEDTLEYYKKTNFLGLSKDYLTKKNTRYNETFLTKELLKVIADKKISSLAELDNFIEKYQDKDGNYDNIINSIKNTPKDINFKEYSNILTEISEKLRSANINFVKIDNTNISKLDISRLKDIQNYTQTILPNILNNILDADVNGNFITKFPKALSENKNSVSYVRNSIAAELTRVQDTSQSYSNIFNNLKLDKNSLELDNTINYSSLVQKIAESLPQRFVDLVNEDYKVDNKTVNLSLHARLRLIERFGFNHINSPEELYSTENKQYLRNIITSIYKQTPDSVEGQEKNRMKITKGAISAIFSNEGRMITIIQA